MKTRYRLNSQTLEFEEGWKVVFLPEPPRGYRVQVRVPGEVGTEKVWNYPAECANHPNQRKAIQFVLQSKAKAPDAIH